MSNHAFDFEVETDDDEHGEIVIHAVGYYTDVIPATMYKSNGDPGDPAEGGEVEYIELSAWNTAGLEVDVSYDYDRLDDMAIEAAEEDTDD